MAKNESEFNQASQNMASLRENGYVVSAHYDSQELSVKIELNTRIRVIFPASLVEGLSDAPKENLSDIEVSPSGLGLYWPKLDVDLYIPSLLQGNFGSKKWMAKQLGSSGGRIKSEAKALSSRENGQKGGRPKKKMTEVKSTLTKKRASG
jgi:hypothetical protein